MTADSVKALKGLIRQHYDQAEKIMRKATDEKERHYWLGVYMAYGHSLQIITCVEKEAQ